MDRCMITASLVQTIIEKRRREIHKGDCGRILLVAGSEGMMGACILAAKGALKSGAGLVTLALPPTLFPIAQIAVPEATCIARDFSRVDLGVYDAVAVGPGLGQSEKSIETMNRILDTYEGPLVVDADGLNLLAKASDGLLPKLKVRRGETVLTPHIGEARRLLALQPSPDGLGVPDVPGVPETGRGPDRAVCSTGPDAGSGPDRAARSTVTDAKGAGDGLSRSAMADALVALTGAVVVLKGAGTLVATKERPSYTNTTGNPGMATGGAGDVLTGIIAGLWGQKQPARQGAAQAGYRRLSAWEAAVCGVFVHGLAGDLAAEEKGEYGLTAVDIADKTPFAIKEILGG